MRKAMKLIDFEEFEVVLSGVRKCHKCLCIRSYRYSRWSFIQRFVSEIRIDYTYNLLSIKLEYEKSKDARLVSSGRLLAPGKKKICIDFLSPLEATGWYQQRFRQVFNEGVSLTFMQTDRWLEKLEIGTH